MTPWLTILSFFKTSFIIHHDYTYLYLGSLESVFSPFYTVKILILVHFGNMILWLYYTLIDLWPHGLPYSTFFKTSFIVHHDHGVTPIFTSQNFDTLYMGNLDHHIALLVKNMYLDISHIVYI
jgi:hypothetical protein